MNLITDAWIPVIAANGTQTLMSLLELFASAHEVRDLAVKPHEKIALLRLLICITQAALDGPEDFYVWEGCRETIAGAVGAYLDQWQPQFELFGDDSPFLQASGLKPGRENGEANPATKLDLTLASGNNASLFDNSAGGMRTVVPARLALTLVTYQCFSPGGRIGIAKWNGVDTLGNGSSNHAPCIPSGMLHTFLQGERLLETIHLNLLVKTDVAELPGRGWGKPGWEMPVKTADDKAAVLNATMTYLGRLAPLSRAIKLDSAGLEMILANGLDYPLYPIFREPAATIVQRKDGPGVMGISLGRSIWRQLSAITVKHRFQASQPSGPIALNNLRDDCGATLWVGGLATDKAKIEDVVEAAYDLPAGMFQDAGRKLYEEGIALANSWHSALWRSIKEYAATLKLEPPPYGRGRQHFWTAVEQHVPRLIALVAAPESAGDLHATDWGKEVKIAARQAYEFACACQSPRQIEAFAIGRQQLFLPKPKDPSSPLRKSSRPKAIA